MNAASYLEINLSKIEANARRIVEKCSAIGVEFWG